MIQRRRSRLPVILAAVLALAATLLTATALAQLPDKTRTPNTAGEGINKSFPQQIGAGRGSITTPDSSLFIINRDPFRAIRRGRQIFQRKFVGSQGRGRSSTMALVTSTSISPSAPRTSSASG